MAKRKTNADIILCDGCIAAIRSRGEKILKGDSIEWVYETPRKKCEWCILYPSPLLNVKRRGFTSRKAYVFGNMNVFIGNYTVERGVIVYVGSVK